MQRGQLLLRADQRDRHARQKMCMHETTTALSHLPRISPKPVQSEAISIPSRHGGIMGRNVRALRVRLTAASVAAAGAARYYAAQIADKAEEQPTYR